jgi:PAS domain S-box-containing protein
VIAELKAYNKTFKKLIDNIEKRGLRIYGLEGEMTKQMTLLNQYTRHFPKEKLLTIERDEHAYKLRQEKQYLYDIEKSIIDIKQNLSGSQPIRKEINGVLDKYFTATSNLVMLDSIIGYDHESGLNGTLLQHNNQISFLIEKLNQENDLLNDKLKKEYNIILFGVILFGTILSLVLSFIFSHVVTDPLLKMTSYIDNIIKNNFELTTPGLHMRANDEIGALGKIINYMVKKIQVNMVQAREYLHQIEAKNVTLIQSEMNFRSTFDQAAVGIAHVGFQGNWIKLNHKLAETVQYKHSELLQLSPDDITNINDRNIDQENIQKLLERKIKNYSVEKRWTSKLGYTVWVDITVSLKYDAAGEPEYFIWVVQDISSRKRAEEDLMYKNKELDTFVYKVSHDLKGPISSLKGLCHISIVDCKDLGSLKYFKEIEKTTNRLNEIILNLIELTRLKDGQIAYSKIDIEDVTNTCLGSLLHLAEYKFPKVNIFNNLKKDFYCDVRFVSTIIQNLLENSIKYSKGNDDSFINISIEDKKNEIALTIEDNGIGIDKEFHNKIFDMFFRATQQSEGTGLGLYIVKNALEKLGGTIEVKSEEGTGSIFHLHFPNNRETKSGV